MVGRLYHLGRTVSAGAPRSCSTFDLSGAADRLVRTYSGGMRRRLDLAAALVVAARALPRRANHWARPGQPVGPSGRRSSALPRAPRCCSRRSTSTRPTARGPHRVIDHGRVIAEGTSEELKSRVGGDRLEAALEHPAARPMPPWPRWAPCAMPPGGRGRHRADAGPGTNGASWSGWSGASTGRSVGIADFALQRPTLDDVFLVLTGHGARRRRRDGGSQRGGWRRLTAARHAPFRHGSCSRFPQLRGPDAQPRARSADLVHAAAADVRAAVRVRVRRRDPDAGPRLRGLP